MKEHFQFDVFLSHSSKDKAVVRAVADRLRSDGVKVWFDEWVLKPGDNIPVKIEEGLEHSRVLVLCMSAHSFGSDWAQLEGGTFRFRDPLNEERRFIPLRLDDAPIKGTLAQFLYVDWRLANCEPEYAKLLAACRPERTPDRPPLHVIAAYVFDSEDEVLKSSEIINRVVKRYGKNRAAVLPSDYAGTKFCPIATLEKVARGHYRLSPEGKLAWMARNK